jgi:hypothetical protein
MSDSSAGAAASAGTGRGAARAASRPQSSAAARDSHDRDEEDDEEKHDGDDVDRDEDVILNEERIVVHRRSASIGCRSEDRWADAVAIPTPEMLARWVQENYLAKRSTPETMVRYIIGLCNFSISCSLHVGSNKHMNLSAYFNLTERARRAVLSLPLACRGMLSHWTVHCCERWRIFHCSSRHWA